MIRNCLATKVDYSYGGYSCNSPDRSDYETNSSAALGVLSMPRALLHKFREGFIL